MKSSRNERIIFLLITKKKIETDKNVKNRMCLA